MPYRWIIPGALLLALIMCGAPALAHEPMGRFGPMQAGDPGYTYLYKEGIDETGARFSKNCCLHTRPDGTFGDCKEYPASKVKIVPGGYLLEDGEFIAHHDTSVSPRDPDGDYRFWRCQHPGALSHCFFSPPNGS